MCTPERTKADVIVENLEELTASLQEPSQRWAYIVRRLQYVVQYANHALNTHIGKDCELCSGRGVRTYCDTATWDDRQGLIAGAAMTDDVCDRCWGTGRNDRKGYNLRELTAAARRVTRVEESEEYVVKRCAFRQGAGYPKCLFAGRKYCRHPLVKKNSVELEQWPPKACPFRCRGPLLIRAG